MTKAERRRQRTQLEEERRTLTAELARTRTRIAQAYSGFNSAGDPDLVESFIYEINSLQARYTYLLRQIKKLEGQQEEEPERSGRWLPLPGMGRPLSAYR